MVMVNSSASLKRMLYCFILILAYKFPLKSTYEVSSSPVDSKNRDALPSLYTSSSLVKTTLLSSMV